MFQNKSARSAANPERSLNKKRALRIGIFVLALILIAFGALAWKTGFILNKIAGGDANLFGSLLRISDQLDGEEEGRINVLLLGMRGEKVEGGGTLADTIMVFSLHPKSGEDDSTRVSLVSIPRDLYVKVPGRDEQRKINAVYALGEERERGGGLDDMTQIISEVTGQPIHYAAAINFQGFKDLVNALGGIDLTLEAPFQEGEQFDQLHVCDPITFTEPARGERGQQLFECKYSQKPRSSTVGMRVTWDAYPQCQNKPVSNIGEYKVMAQYPLCHNSNPECGGDFMLPAGENHLDGDKALCYARSRYQSNDFERAARQQEVIDAMKRKALSLGTLTDFSKLNDILDSLGDNVVTNLEAWEFKRFYELQRELGTDAPVESRVLSDSEEGLLYAPPQQPESGYILLPRGDNYDRIHALFRDILNP